VSQLSNEDIYKSQTIKIETEIDNFLKNINKLKSYLIELRKTDWNEFPLKYLKKIYKKLEQCKKCWADFNEVEFILNDFADFFSFMEQEKKDNEDEN